MANLDVTSLLANGAKLKFNIKPNMDYPTDYPKSLTVSGPVSKAAGIRGFPGEPYGSHVALCTVVIAQQTTPKMNSIKAKIVTGTNVPHLYPLGTLIVDFVGPIAGSTTVTWSVYNIRYIVG